MKILHLKHFQSEQYKVAENRIRTCADFAIACLYDAGLRSLRSSKVKGERRFSWL